MTMTKEEALEYITSLVELEELPDHERSAIELGPLGTFVLISALQLAMRHPGMSSRMRGEITELVTQAKRMFIGTPGEELLAPNADLREIAESLGPVPAGHIAEIEVTDEGTRLTVETTHPIIYDGYRVVLTVDAGTSNPRSAWLLPDDADQAARNLISAAYHARQRDAEDREIEQRGIEAQKWLADHPPRKVTEN